MDEFIKQANIVSPLTGEAAKDLYKSLETYSLNKGEILNPVGKICRHLFFVESGLLKHCYYYKGRQFILRFFSENKFFVITDSFFKNLPADYSAITLEETKLTYLTYKKLEALCHKHHSFESFIRKFTSQIAELSVERLKDMLHTNATERYDKFLLDYADLRQRISLGDTASFMGISQVSLSRIRSKK